MLQKQILVQLDEIIIRTPNVKSFRFLDKDRLAFKAGQFMNVCFADTKDMCRYLSISSSPTENYMEFTKKLSDSDFSKKLNKARVGDFIKIKYPSGQFIFEGQYEKICFLSGGIGITPIRSICKYIFDNKLDTKVALLYGNKTAEDIAFKDEFDQLQKSISNLKVINILSEEEQNWCGKTGYIDVELIKLEVPDYMDTKFYICGPPNMVSCMLNILVNELGLPNNDIITEHFIGY